MLCIRYGLSKKVLLVSECRQPFLRTLVAAGNTKPLNTISDDIPNLKKLLKIAIIGTPNAGKSTLVNQLVGRRVFPISKKVHTTRWRAKAVCVQAETQLIFLDTPGIVSVSETQKYKLGTEFVSGGEDAIEEADVIGVLHDLSNSHTKSKLDPKVLRLLHLYQDKESFLVLNKIDTIKSKRHLLDLSTVLTGGKLKSYQSEKKLPLSELDIAHITKIQPYWENFSDVFMVSALLGEGTNDLKKYLINSAHPGEWPFPEESFTDQKPVKIIEETVRSKLLEYLPHEIPYGLTTQLEYLDFDKYDNIVAVVLVSCKTPKIEKIVMGSGGHRIRTIAKEAEQDLSDTFMADVHLKVNVTKMFFQSEQATVIKNNHFAT